jgi:phosphatidylglycerophosphate synthase
MAADGAAANGQTRLMRSALVAVGVALVALVALSAGASRELELSPAYVPKVLTIFAVIAALVLAGLSAHPFMRFGVANQVTLGRAAVASLLAGLVGEGASPSVGVLAVVLGGVAAVLDSVDGPLARATGSSSAFGARFDMETDAVLVLALAALAWQLGKAGPWVLASGLLRYAFVAAGWLLAWMQRPLEPSFRRKAVCAAQMAALVAALALNPPASALIAAAALALLCYSFAADTLWLHSRKEER